jgi:hypothetical protein
MSIEYDPSKMGLSATLKDYQEIALKVIWASQKGLGSKGVWDRVNAELKGKTISRASVINFLEDMRQMGVLRGVEETGKGGHHWIYSAAMTEAEYKSFIAATVLGSLMRDFPSETKTAIAQAGPY